MIPIENFLDIPAMKHLDILEATLITLKCNAKGMTALELSAQLKRAVEFIEAIRDDILYDANKEFQNLQTEHPLQSVFELLDGKASVAVFTPKTVWELPDNLLTAQKALADAIAKAKKDGLVKKAKAKKINPVEDSLFAITVVKDFK